MIALISILILALYSALEGWREYCYYEINRAAKFSLPVYDKTRSAVNAITFGFFAALLGVAQWGIVLWPLVIFAILSMAIRWLFLDLVLNRFRHLNLFYVGTRKRIDLVIRSLSPSWVSVELFAAAIKLGVLVGSITAIYYCHEFYRSGAFWLLPGDTSI